MQFAVTESKPVQAGKDAPRYAECIYCGMPVELMTVSYRMSDNKSYYYLHTSDLSATECQKLRDRAQEELNKVLNI